MVIEVKELLYYYNITLNKTEVATERYKQQKMLRSFRDGRLVPVFQDGWQPYLYMYIYIFWHFCFRNICTNFSWETMQARCKVMKKERTRIHKWCSISHIWDEETESYRCPMRCCYTPQGFAQLFRMGRS